MIRINSISILFILYNINCVWKYKMCCIVFKKEICYDIRYFSFIVLEEKNLDI